MAFGGIIIGDEILSGRRQDRHLAKLIELLAARGLQLAWARYCGDDPARLTGLLRESFASGDIVFSFGGIGATPDDHTRQCAAAAAGVPLCLHAEAEAAIRARFGAETTPLRLRLGEFPQGARIIPNPYNQIPGFALGTHHFLPGFPEMAWPMAAWVLDTWFAGEPAQALLAEASLRVYGVREGELIELMEQLQSAYGVSIFSLPSLSTPEREGHIELGAKGAPAAVAAAMAAIGQEMARRRLRCEVAEDTRPGRR